MNAAGRLSGNRRMRDKDYCITTRELLYRARRESTSRGLVDEDYDDPMGEGSGAGKIFREYRGGVMEAAVMDSVPYEPVREHTPPLLHGTAVREFDGAAVALPEQPSMTM